MRRKKREEAAYMLCSVPKLVKNDPQATANT
jgi:hypothetical protein